MILLAVIHPGDGAYGVPITRELEQQRGREVAAGSVYAALDRMEAKGLVISSLGDPSPERGGYFSQRREGAARPWKESQPEDEARFPRVHVGLNG